MAITMMEPTEVLSSPFEHSHLYDKLRSIVVVSRIYESAQELHSLLHAAAEFDLDNPKVFGQVKADYEAIREKIRATGIDSVSGDLGQLVQARSKGRGHASTPRAFYARPRFVEHVLNRQKRAVMSPACADGQNALSCAKWERQASG